MVAVALDALPAVPYPATLTSASAAVALLSIASTFVAKSPTAANKSAPSVALPSTTPCRSTSEETASITLVIVAASSGSAFLRTSA